MLIHAIDSLLIFKLRHDAAFLISLPNNKTFKVECYLEFSNSKYLSNFSLNRRRKEKKLYRLKEFRLLISIFRLLVFFCLLGNHFASFLYIL